MGKTVLGMNDTKKNIAAENIVALKPTTLQPRRSPLGHAVNYERRAHRISY